MARSHIAQSNRTPKHLTYAEIVELMRFDPRVIDRHLDTVLKKLDGWNARLTKGGGCENGVFNEAQHLVSCFILFAVQRDSLDSAISELEQHALWDSRDVCTVLVMSTLRYLLTDYAEGIGKRQPDGPLIFPPNAAKRIAASAKPVLSCCRRMSWSFRPEQILALGL